MRRILGRWDLHQAQAICYRDLGIGTRQPAYALFIVDYTQYRKWVGQNGQQLHFHNHEQNLTLIKLSYPLILGRDSI